MDFYKGELKLSGNKSSFILKAVTLTLEARVCDCEYRPMLVCVFCAWAKIGAYVSVCVYRDS